MLGFILKGGILMYPILLCSVIAVTIIVERLIHLHRARIKIPDFLNEIEKYLKAGELDKALHLAEVSPGPVASVVGSGIRNYTRNSSRDWEKTISMVGSKELRRLEKNLRGLGIIAHISPLLGLLGTVTGMIKAFIEIQKLGGRVDASVLAGGIWEALLTTAAGLAVAIPTMFAYHYFEGRVDDFSSWMKDAVYLLTEWLSVREPESKEEDKQQKEDIEYGV